MQQTKRFMVGQDGQLIPMNGQPQGLSVPQPQGGGMSIPQQGGMYVPQSSGLQIPQSYNVLQPGQVIEIVNSHNQVCNTFAQVIASLPKDHGVRFSSTVEIYEED